MSACVILNPRAGAAAQQELDLERRLGERAGITLRVTGAPGEAAEVAALAQRAGFDLVVAAGGDGTVNEVLNGLFEGAHQDDGRPDALPAAALGVLPLGTGNDLARTLDLPLDDPLACLELVLAAERRTLDVAVARFEGRQRRFLNVAAGGFSGEVDEALTDEVKSRWGPLAYVRSALGVIPDLTRYDTRLALDDGPERRVRALNVIVANGRTAAGGLAVAPHADPEDGLLDVVTVHPGSKLDLAGVAARLLAAGNYVNSDIVSLRRARRMRIESHPGMWFNLDGELMTRERVEFEAIPRALRVAVGPGYSPSGEPPAAAQPEAARPSAVDPAQDVLEIRDGP